VEERNTKKDAVIGGIAGLGSGLIGGTLMHPYESYTLAVQAAARRGNNGQKPKFSYYSAPFHKEMWAGVRHSAVRKGVNYGLNLGIAFGIASILRNYLAKNNTKLNSLGFHKNDNNRSS
jgi:hypothetical protein